MKTLLVAGLLFLAGCSSQSSVMSSNAKAESQQPPASPSASSDNATQKEASKLRAELLLDAKKNKPLLITPKVGIGPIRFGMTKKDLEKVMGKPYRVTGKAHEYQHLGFAVIFDRQDKVGAILGGAWCEISDIMSGTSNSKFAVLRSSSV